MASTTQTVVRGRLLIDAFDEPQRVVCGKTDKGIVAEQHKSDE